MKKKIILGCLGGSALGLLLAGLLILALIGLYSRNLDEAPSGTIQFDIDVNGKTRMYLLHVPASHNPSQPVPLILSFHGFASWPANQMEVSQWNELADEYGFLAAYPAGTDVPRRWKTGAFGTETDPTQELDFIRKLIDKVDAAYPLDPARIYANGLSNGGGMSYMLACNLSDRIAAFGGVAGAYILPSEECRPVRPIPAIFFHGTADPIVPYAGGRSGGFDIPFPNIPDWVQGWAERNGCDQQAEFLPVQGDASGLRYSSCDAGAEVVFYTIEGGGHSWPGGGYLPEIIVGPTSQDIDATRLMWEFFLRHPLADEIAVPE